MEIGGIDGRFGGTCKQHGHASTGRVDFNSTPLRKVRVSSRGRFTLSGPSNGSLGHGRYTLKGKFSGPKGTRLTGTVTLRHQHQAFGDCGGRATFRGKRTYQIA